MTENPGFQIRPEFNPLSIIRSVWKHKLMVVLAGGVAAAVVAGIVYTLPAVYSSYTLIQIEQQRLPDRFVQSTVNTNLSDRLARLETEILSYGELLNIADSFGLYADERDSLTEEEVVKKLRAAIDVQVRGGFAGRTNTSAFSVSYQGTEPELVQQVAQQLGTLFINKNQETRENDARGTAEFLKRQLEDSKRQLEYQEKLLAEYRIQHNGQLPENQSTLLAQLSSLRVQLNGVQDEESRLHETKIRLESDLELAQTSLTNLQRQAEEFKAAAPEIVTAPGAEQGVVLTPLETALMRKYQSLRAELGVMLTRLTPSHPDVRRKQAEADQLEGQLRASIESRKDAPADAQPAGPAVAPIDPATAQRARQLESDLQAQNQRIASVRQQMEFRDRRATQLAAERQQLLADLNSVNSRLQGIPLLSAEMTSKLRDYDTKRKNYDSMLSKLLEADVAAEMEVVQKSERFSMLERARVPAKPISPNRQLLMSMGVPACFAVALVLAFILELKKNVMLGEWELPKSVPVLGRVPPIYQAPAAAGPIGRLTNTGGHGRFGWLNPLAWRPSVALPVLLLGVVAVIIVTGIRMGWIPV